MKTSLLFILALFVGFALSAQQFAKIPADKSNIIGKAHYIPAVADPTGPTTLVFRQNDGPRAVSATESIVGLTTFDLQSNACTQNRLYVYPDNAVAAVWTQGYLVNDSYSDRGTGYNYYDGSWSPNPTARIKSETIKNGWPSYAPLGNGEMIIAHNGVNDLTFSTRAERGTGSWITGSVPKTTGLTWHRAITNKGVIHLIVPSATDGQTNALVYLSSSDKGVTWTDPTVLPGLGKADLPIRTVGFTGFGGDDYIWAEPKGDTIAFAVGHYLGGLWVMKSFDNGKTWQRITVYEFPDFTGTDSPDVCTFDECFAMALDNEGRAHVALTRYKMVHYNSTAASWNYYPYTDGIVYWNETMPKIDTSLYNNVDSLVAHNMYVGYMIDYNGNGTIDFPTVGTDQLPWGEYRYVGPTGMPMMVIDNHDNIFISYSACREDLIAETATPNVQLYKHLYLAKKLHGGDWITPVDVTDDPIHAYDEVVWPNMVVGPDGTLHFLAQTDPEPGINLAGDLDYAGDNYMLYIGGVATGVGVKPLDITKDVAVYPNPATDFSKVVVQLRSSEKVNVDIYDVRGKLVTSKNYGQQSTGYHTYNMTTSTLPKGVYIFNVKIGNSQTSRKVIVK